jgi:hypothetical protein
VVVAGALVVVVGGAVVVVVVGGAVVVVVVGGGAVVVVKGWAPAAVAKRPRCSGTEARSARAKQFLEARGRTTPRIWMSAPSRVTKGP